VVKGSSLGVILRRQRIQRIVNQHTVLVQTVTTVAVSGVERIAWKVGTRKLLHVAREEVVVQSLANAARLVTAAMIVLGKPRRKTLLGPRVI
jgi:hypothetical protein